MLRDDALDPAYRPDRPRSPCSRGRWALSFPEHGKLSYLCALGGPGLQVGGGQGNREIQFNPTTAQTLRAVEVEEASIIGSDALRMESPQTSRSAGDMAVDRLHCAPNVAAQPPIGIA
jgi:hypothetical protein